MKNKNMILIFAGCVILGIVFGIITTFIIFSPPEPKTAETLPSLPYPQFQDDIALSGFTSGTDPITNEINGSSFEINWQFENRINYIQMCEIYRLKMTGYQVTYKEYERGSNKLEYTTTYFVPKEKTFLTRDQETFLINLDRTIPQDQPYSLLVEISGEIELAVDEMGCVTKVSGITGQTYWDCQDSCQYEEEPTSVKQPSNSRFLIANWQAKLSEETDAYEINEEDILNS